MVARISGAASRLAAALSTSPAARAGGKFLGAATGGYGLFNAGEQALTETVPYGAAAGGGERRRFAPPAWLASRLPEDMQPVDAAAMLELPPLKPGEVQFHSMSPSTPAHLQLLLKEAAQAVLAALQQEARSRPDGFGRHILDAGVHIFVDTACHGLDCVALEPNVIGISPEILTECYRHTPDGAASVAAFQFSLAHAMARLYLRHDTELWQLGLAKAPQAAAAVVSFMQQLKSLAPAGTLTTSAADVHLFMASKTKALQWQQAFEADEVACAVLARLRVPSEQWASALRAWGASQLRELERCTGIWEQAAKMAVDKGGATAAVYAATAARLGWPSFEEGAARLREAVARGDVDDAAQLCEAFLATLAYSLASYKLSSEAGRGVGEDSSDEHCTKYGTSRVCPSSIVGPGACPEPAAPAMLTDLRTTMPPFSARLAHVQHLAGQLPMQLRPTAPPVAVGGRYSPGSVAEQIVKRGTDAMKAEKAGEQAAQQEEDAPKPAAASR